MSNASDEVREDEWLMLEIDRAPGPVEFKEHIKSVLRGMAGRSMYWRRSVVVKTWQVGRALELLEAQRTVAQTRAALLDSGVAASERTAYRLIQLALAERGKSYAQKMGRAQADLFGELVGAQSLAVSEED